MKEKDYCLYGMQEVSSNSKGRRMQINVLRTKQVSHVGNRDDHGQPIATRWRRPEMPETGWQ